MHRELSNQQQQLRFRNEINVKNKENKKKTKKQNPKRNSSHEMHVSCTSSGQISRRQPVPLWISSSLCALQCAVDHFSSATEIGWFKWWTISEGSDRLCVLPVPVCVPFCLRRTRRTFAICCAQASAGKQPALKKHETNKKKNNKKQ